MRSLQSPRTVASRTTYNTVRGRANARWLFAHEALAGGADEGDSLGEEDAHGVAQRDRLLVDRARRLDLPERGRGQVDGGVERQRGELLAVGVGNRLGLALRELTQAAQQGPRDRHRAETRIRRCLPCDQPSSTL